MKSFRHIHARRSYLHLQEKAFSALTAHNWQKRKSRFFTSHSQKTYREEAVGLKSFSYTLKNYDFCENVKFGAI